MTNLVVITYDNLDNAHEARKALGNLEKQGLLKVIDAAVIHRGVDNRLHVNNELESSTKTGALVGGLLGSLLFFMFPLAGILVGVIGGALVGKSIEPGIDQKFVREVSAGLKPGTSALFFMFEAEDLDATMAALRQFKGKIYQTTLSSETEESLRQSLEKSAMERHPVLDTLTSTQMDELENQVSENDKEGFRRRAERFGWDAETTEQVWRYMSHKPNQQEVLGAFTSQGENTSQSR